jgi:hypothetical protein
MDVDNNPRSTVFAIIIFVVGLLLLLLNTYGLSQSLRPDGLVTPHLRFGERDLRLSEEQFFASVERGPSESDIDFARRMTTVIADGMAHVHWERYPEDQFNQRVPVWENYILWAMGKVSGIPEFERYHFSNPAKSMSRGIGICGDASMLMSQLLDSNGISNRLVTVPGHVLVEAKIDNRWVTFDPDFGVVLGTAAADLASNAQRIGSIYRAHGFKYYEVAFIEDRLAFPPTYWNGVSHFITKKYYFEKVSYLLKWLIPVALMLAGGSALVLRFRKRSAWRGRAYS